MFVILINMLSNWCFSGQAQKLIPESLADVWKKLLAVRRLLDTLDGYFKKGNCSLMALEMELAFSLKTFWDFFYRKLNKIVSLEAMLVRNYEPLLAQSQPGEMFVLLVLLKREFWNPYIWWTHAHLVVLYMYLNFRLYLYFSFYLYFSLYLHLKVCICPRSGHAPRYSDSLPTESQIAVRPWPVFPVQLYMCICLCIYIVYVY